MEILALIILGVVQGITEFLPISSSGHLVLLSRLFGISDSLFVSIVLHVATLLSIIVVFRKDIIQMIKKPFAHENILLAIATIPTCIIALVLLPIITESFEGKILGICFFITAIVLLFTSHKKEEKGEIGVKNALIMGVAQGLAIFPGISRSGSTICAGILSGSDREKTTKFSFLMSIPIILLSLAMEVVELIYKPEISVNIPGLILSFLFAFLIGIVAIKFMLNKMQKSSYKWVSLYLILISILTLFI